MLKKACKNVHFSDEGRQQLLGFSGHQMRMRLAVVTRHWRAMTEWNEQANLSGYLLRGTKHFPSFNVFTCEEKIS